ncbi:MAG: CoA transferase, partial [Janthinobacterium lividum]
MSDIPSAQSFLSNIWAALDGNPALPGVVSFTGEGSLRCAFAVSDLAVGSVAAAALAVADYAGLPPSTVTVDRRLASFWFGWSFRARGWTPPPDRNPVSGDYQESMQT